MSDKLTIYAKNNLPGVSRGRRNYGLAKGGSVDIHTIAGGTLVAAVADPEKLTEAQRAEIARVIEQEQKRSAPKAAPAPAPETQPTA